MSFYQEVSTGQTGSKQPLPAGVYGTKDAAGLKVVSYIGSRETKTPGLNRHSFLVASTDSVDGTAFLAIQLKDQWTLPAFCALAFGAEEQALASGEVTADDLTTAKTLIAEEAARKVTEANTPEDAVAEATEKAIEGIKTQIKINVGTIFRLQDWKGEERDPRVSLSSLTGTKFAGTVKEGLETTDVATGAKRQSMDVSVTSKAKPKG